MRDYIYERVCEYIEDEIDYIEKEMSLRGFGKDDLRDLLMLKDITEVDINEIVEKVVEDNAINDIINETIHYYLYH